MPQVSPRSKKSKDCLYRNPRRNPALVCIARWIESPAADGLRRPLVQSKANAPDHSNFRGLSVGSDKHA
jgi:hypothetical protein